MARNITLSIILLALVTFTMNDAQARKVVYKKVYTTVTVPGYITNADVNQCNYETRFIRRPVRKQNAYNLCIQRIRDSRATTRVVVTTRPVYVSTPVRHKRPVVISTRPHYTNRRPVVVKRAPVKRPVRYVAKKAPAHKASRSSAKSSGRSAKSSSRRRK
ncbi:hypothetical protein KKF84_15900 [Myxococcota bacterium]|nr:hypothetical protein [Myxococcota bacterium]MBU1536809.1 hypothetical protein [Myxococcota bacterium]